jgi:hypothetical protein
MYVPGVIVRYVGNGTKGFLFPTYKPEKNKINIAWQSNVWATYDFDWLKENCVTMGTIQEYYNENENNVECAKEVQKKEQD